MFCVGSTSIVIEGSSAESYSNLSISITSSRELIVLPYLAVFVAGVCNTSFEPSSR